MGEDDFVDILFSDEIEAQRVNQQYVQNNLGTLQDQYGDQHVFVLDQGVIDTMAPLQEHETGDEYRQRVEEQFDELRDEYGDRFDEIYEQFIPDPDTTYMFMSQ